MSLAYFLSFVESHQYEYFLLPLLLPEQVVDRLLKVANVDGLEYLTTKELEDLGLKIPPTGHKWIIIEAGYQSAYAGLLASDEAKIQIPYLKWSATTIKPLLFKHTLFMSKNLFVSATRRILGATAILSEFRETVEKKRVVGLEIVDRMKIRLLKEPNEAEITRSSQGLTYQELMADSNHWFLSKNSQDTLLAFDIIPIYAKTGLFEISIHLPSLLDLSTKRSIQAANSVGWTTDEEGWYTLNSIGWDMKANFNMKGKRLGPLLPTPVLFQLVNLAVLCLGLVVYKYLT